MKLSRISLLVAATLPLLMSVPLAAQTTAFTYQGRLYENSNPVSGIYDLVFSMHDAVDKGNPVSPSVFHPGLAVSNGLFTVNLDFGAGVYTGAPRWLEIGARTNGAASGFTLLRPRQEMTSIPYAIKAGSVEAADIVGNIDSSHIAEGSITGSMLTTGSVTQENLADGAVDVGKLATRTMLLNQVEFNNPAPADLDYFGGSISGVGTDRVVIGAWLDDIAGDTLEENSGAAYVFDLQGDLLTVLTNPWPRRDDFFGRTVASAGMDRIMVSAPNAEVGGPGLGVVFVFDLQGNLLQSINRPGRGGGESFGNSLAGMGNDKVIVGDPEGESNGNEPGVAYLFALNGMLITTLTNPAPENGDLFGSSVSAVGSDKILIGAMEDNGGTGGAYLFSTEGQLLTSFTNPTSGRFQNFGRSGAGVGSGKVLIGADGESMDGTIRGAGAAYLFDLNGNLLTTFTNPTPASDDFFGFAVSSAGPDRVLIGAHGDDTVDRDAGAAYLYDLGGQLITILTNSPMDFPRDGRFGYAVNSLGYDTLLIGARDHEFDRSRAGQAYLYVAGRILPGLAQIVGDASVFSTSIQDGAVLAGKIANGAVTTEKLANEAVTSEKLARFSVTSQHIAPFSIRASMFAETVGVWGRAGSTMNSFNYNVGIRTNNTEGSALSVNGDTRITGLIRAGSETLTSEPPSPAGLVMRRINSRSSTAGQIVARTDLLSLERDGTPGGFRIRYNLPPETGGRFIACMGMNNAGEQRNFFATIPYEGIGSDPIYSDSDGVVFFQCSFGGAGEGDHLTQVTLSRWANNNWVGTVISTYNQ